MTKSRKQAVNNVNANPRLEEIQQILMEVEHEAAPRVAKSIAKFKKLLFDELTGQGFTTEQAIAILVASPEC